MTSHEFDAAIFDMDGVITQTATLHARAWKQAFDDYFARRMERKGDSRAPFDIDVDYRTYVDDKPRHEGVRSFLAARGIELPEGDPADGSRTAARTPCTTSTRASSKSSSAGPCPTAAPGRAAASRTSRSATATSPPSCSP